MHWSLTWLKSFGRIKGWILPRILWHPEDEKAKISSRACSKQRWTFRMFWWTSLGLNTWTWMHKGQVFMNFTKTGALHKVHYYHMREGSKRCWSDKIWHWRCAFCWAEWCGCPKCRRLCSNSFPRHPATLLTWTRMLPYIGAAKQTESFWHMWNSEIWHWRCAFWWVGLCDAQSAGDCAATLSPDTQQVWEAMHTERSLKLVVMSQMFFSWMSHPSPQA